MAVVQECHVASGRPYSSKNVRKESGIECVKRPINAFGLMDVILLYSGHQHILVTCGHLYGAENKNTDVIKMCVNHSTFLKIM